MKEFNIEEEYKKLKFKLPNFKRLDDEFEISYIDKKPFLLRAIRRKINEKIIFFCRIIENLLYPTTNNIITITENKHLSEEKKEKLAKLYKKLMIFERKSLELDIEGSDKDDVDFINNVFSKWESFKKILKPVIKDMQEAWKIEEQAKKDEGYFG